MTAAILDAFDPSEATTDVADADVIVVTRGEAGQPRLRVVIDGGCRIVAADVGFGEVG